MWREVESFQAQDEQGTTYPAVVWEWSDGSSALQRQAKVFLQNQGWVEVPEVCPGLYLIGVGTYARRV